jgi:hypothetical protein
MNHTTRQPTPLTCEQCFTTILTPEQLNAYVNCLNPGVTIADFCGGLQQRNEMTEAIFRSFLSYTGIPYDTANQLVQCLKNAGIVFYRDSI